MESDDEQQEQGKPLPDDSPAGLRVCSACGEPARRAEARFCAACGVSMGDSYLPADALRASYNLQHRRRVSRRGGATNNKSPKHFMSSIVIATNRNSASTTALAFVTYALVPYLGILFCPGALVMGGIGLYSSYRLPERGGRRASYFSVMLGLVILFAQLFLWWILYKIPEWTTGP